MKLKNILLESVMLDNYNDIKNFISKIADKEGEFSTNVLNGIKNTTLKSPDKFTEKTISGPTPSYHWLWLLVKYNSKYKLKNSVIYKGSNPVVTFDEKGALDTIAKDEQLIKDTIKAFNSSKEYAEIKKSADAISKFSDDYSRGSGRSYWN